MKRLAALFLILVLTSCGTERLAVQSEYLLPGRYASVWVGTPDPHKAYPEVGQRLIIRWKLRPEMAHYDQIILKFRIRFRNYEMLEKCYVIKCPVGRIIYKIMNDDYNCTEGIAAYTVEIVGDGAPIAKVQHHLWRELISIEDDDEFEGEPEDLPEEFDYEPDFQEGESFYEV